MELIAHLCLYIQLPVYPNPHKLSLRITKIPMHLQNLFVLFLLLASIFHSPSHGERDSRPNVIVFLVDDYDKPETSPYGGKVLTPNLDRLAREGMLFLNAYVTSTVCTPSRYTMLTGRYAGSSHSDKFLSEFPLRTTTLNQTLMN